jgi:hypothetical protein
MSRARDQWRTSCKWTGNVHDIQAAAIARVEAITAAESSTKAVAHLSAEFLTHHHLGHGLIRNP